MSRTAKTLLLAGSFLGLASSAQAYAQVQVQSAKGFAKSQLAAKSQSFPVVTPGTASAGGGLLNDDCATPDALMGQGAFSYDNTAATTGVEGQAETDCTFFGSTTIDNDLWFTWTADEDGMATINTCASVGGDTKIAAYDGAGCPTAPTIACNDDACGLLSEIVFPVTTGTAYTLQVGNFPGSAGSPQVLTIDIMGGGGGAPANDECATPDVLVGEGMFSYDNSAATTGVEGQAETDCTFFGSTAIDNDLWFSWTATATGVATINTCDSKGGDTKIAAYDGVGCPTAAVIACNDDSCGLLSEIVFDVTLGTTYTLQVGNFPGAAGGGQALTVAIEPDCYTIDDGTSENSIGLGGGEILWLNGFNAIGGSDVISEVSTAFNILLTPGATGSVVVYDDVTNDFDPSDAVLLFSGPIVSAGEGTGALTSYAIPDVAVNGVFFVGINLAHVDMEFPAPLDAAFPGDGRSWAVGGPVTDLVDLTNNGLIGTIDSFGFPGTWVLRAVGENCTLPTIGTPMCDPGNPNSSGGSGALVAEGSDVAFDNNLTFIASGLPMNQTGFLVNSMASQMIPISDGLLCIGPGFGRHNDMAGNSGMTGEIATTVDLTNLPRSSGPEPALPGQTWYFQFWYRDGAGVSNFTNSLEILFQ